MALHGFRSKTDPCNKQLDTTSHPALCDLTVVLKDHSNMLMKTDGL